MNLVMAAASGAAQTKIVARKPGLEVVCGCVKVAGWLAEEKNDYHHYVPLTSSLWPDSSGVIHPAAHY